MSDTTRSEGEETPPEIDILPTDVLFECPACDQSMVADESAIDQAVRCPRCHQTVIVPPRAITLGDVMHGLEAKLEQVAPHDVLFNCPICGQSLVIESVAAGAEVPCAGCSSTIIVPRP